MKKQIFFTFLIFVISASLSFSQTERLDYNKVDYIRVNPADSEQFVKLVKEVMKPAYEQLVATGKIKNWRLYFVEYPGGERSEYNFVCIATATDIQTFENQFSAGTSLQYMPVLNGQEDEDLASLSNVVASEIWKIRSLFFPDTTFQKPAKYMTMDYMNVVQGRGLEYLMLEDEVAMPLHQERVRRDQMKGWEVFSLVVPGGTEYGYNYATGNYYDQLSHMEFGFTQELIKHTMPGTNVGELLNTIYETRDLVKSEVWELIEYAD